MLPVAPVSLKCFSDTADADAEHQLGHLPLILRTEAKSRLLPAELLVVIARLLLRSRSYGSFTPLSHTSEYCQEALRAEMKRFVVTDGEWSSLEKLAASFMSDQIRLVEIKLIASRLLALTFLFLATSSCRAERSVRTRKQLFGLRCSRGERTTSICSHPSRTGEEKFRLIPHRFSEASAAHSFETPAYGSTFFPKMCKERELRFSSCIRL